MRAPPSPTPRRQLSRRRVLSTAAAFASIRMEPQFMVLSESAAHAAHLAIADNASVQAIDKFRRRLLDAGQVLDAKKP